MFNYIYINKNNLINNINITKQQNPNALICVMVKANAYGVGLSQVVKSTKHLVDFFGVANNLEAKKVRKLCNNKVLVVGALEKSNLDVSVSYACHSFKDVCFLASLNLPFNVHLKVNSGMNRFGFSNLTDFKNALLKIKNSMLNLEGVFTHFATGDSFVSVQFKKFKKFVKLCNNFGFNPIVHADNSIVSLTQNHNLDMVRVGFNLYASNQGNFLPPVEIETEIVQVNKIKPNELVGYNRRFVSTKNMRVAVLPVGYADGFDMHYLGLKLNVCGKKCKVLNICMDCFMLDISQTKLQLGDRVKILSASNPLELYANYLATSEYEILTKFSCLRGKRIIINKNPIKMIKK